MLGALRKTTIGLGALGLLAAGLTIGPAPVNAAPGDNVCVIAAQPADVFNVEYGVTGAGHPGGLVDASPQRAMGSWKPPGSSVAVPRYGLYYPVTDPVTDHAVIRNGNSRDTAHLAASGANSSVPSTPLHTGDHFLFAQSGTCENNDAGFLTKGTAIGYCGRSVGLGVGTVGGRVSIIRWESVGSQLIMLDPTARGSVNAQANPPSDTTKGSCRDGTAITFLVDGALVDTTRPAT